MALTTLQLTVTAQSKTKHTKNERRARHGGEYRFVQINED
jgi:CelD/BcsL family acetyltransferase involved in cellulose biosynthesis